MRFQPITKDEASARGLLPPKDYDFDVSDAVECRSKSGNDQIKVKLHISGRYIFDYLVATKKAAWKMHNFCEAVGLADNYQSGEIRAEDLIGRSGKLLLTIEKSTNPEYPDPKNAVEDYLPAASEEISLAKDDDDIPF